MLLILGCHGHNDAENFTYCKGVSNPIIELKYLKEYEYEKTIEFFDNACGLFDSVVDDYNKCSNILNMLYKNYKVISPEMLKKIQYYLNIHKMCRPYLALILREDYYE
jgi:hypothetical protein